MGDDSVMESTEKDGENKEGQEGGGEASSENKERTKSIAGDPEKEADKSSAEQDKSGKEDNSEGSKAEK